MSIRPVLVFSLVLISFLLPYHLIVTAVSLTPDQQQVFNFLKSDAPIDNFTQAELSHLDDVKAVMNGAAAVSFVIIVLTIFIMLHVQDRKSFLVAWLIVLSIDTVLLLLAIFSFNQLFSSFHSIFFAEGTWTFPSDSRLIKLFPLTFFVTITKRILIGSLLFSLVLLGITSYPKKLGWKVGEELETEVKRKKWIIEKDD